MSEIRATDQSVETRFDGVVEFFGPQWFGTTMGTGALGVALSLVAGHLGWGWLSGVAQAFVLLTAVLTVAYLGPWTLRFVRYPDRVVADLTHPIRGQFFPTMPITLVVLGVGIARTMPGVLPPATLKPLLTGLFVVGSVGIFAFGLVVLPVLFANDRVGAEHGVFAWYIPPVSHLVIPILGLLLVSKFYAGTAVGQGLFVVSMFALGVGTFMFLFVGAIVLYRYAYHGLPREKLTPTFVIGLAPTAVLVIDTVRLAHALEAGVGLSIALEPLLPLLKLLALLLWGFSAWWFLLTVALVSYEVGRRRHGFFFTWWAYTFPIGAFAISGGALGTFLGYPLFGSVLCAVTGVLGILWFVTAGLTGRMILAGEAFVPE
jgi:C4-dicarboxylate transporter/malic acid transport protein